MILNGRREWRRTGCGGRAGGGRGGPPTRPGGRRAETTDVAGVLRAARGAVLIDGIGAWLAAVMDECGAWQGGEAARAALAARTGELAAAWRQTGAYVVAVSD